MATPSHLDYIYPGKPPKIPPPLPANNCYKVLALGRLEGQRTVNTFYYADDRPRTNAP